MRVHLIAIGGSAMHNLAISLKKNGHVVSGSDDEIFEPSKERLKKYRLLPQREGWYPENITRELDFVILGMHAHLNNPELIKAQQLGLKIYSYPEFLYRHSKTMQRIVIGGSHGKTTITAMVMHVLKYHGRDFDYIVGSKLKDFEVMVRLSKGAPIMIFEGDEYLSSPLDRRPKFHWYHPHLALLTGIAWDHINVFPTFEYYMEQFQKFIALMEPGATLVYNENDKYLKAIVGQTQNSLRKIPYSLPEFEIIQGVTFIRNDKNTIPLKIFGRHNLMNLNGARLLCGQLGLDRAKFYEAIQSFEGAANRLELVFKNAAGRFYKDFAHSPSKLKATLAAVREQFPRQRLVACFELHTFSSLNPNFLGQYHSTMNGADEALVYFNPHALEIKRLPGLEKASIKSAFGRDNLLVFNDSDILVHWLKENTYSNDIFLLMSSGNFNGININTLAKELLGKKN